MAFSGWLDKTLGSITQKVPVLPVPYRRLEAFGATVPGRDHTAYSQPYALRVLTRPGPAYRPLVPSRCPFWPLPAFSRFDWLPHRTPRAALHAAHVTAPFSFYRSAFRLLAAAHYTTRLTLLAVTVVDLPSSTVPAVLRTAAVRGPFGSPTRTPLVTLRFGLHVPALHWTGTPVHTYTGGCHFRATAPPYLTSHYTAVLPHSSSTTLGSTRHAGLPCVPYRLDNGFAAIRWTPYLRCYVCNTRYTHCGWFWTPAGSKPFIARFMHVWFCV